MAYEVTIHTVRPGTAPGALAAMQGSLAAGRGKLLACWSSEIGALNRILVIREADPAAREAAAAALASDDNPFGINEFAVASETDVFIPFPFVEAMQPGERGPFFEVRTYELHPAGLPRTVELWRKALPGRCALSPILAAMYATTGTLTRLMHIWPYRSLNERQQIRAKAIADKVWPPPGGTAHFASMRTDIYLPAPFSPLK